MSTAQPYGPNTAAVLDLLAQVRAMTPEQAEKAALAWAVVDADADAATYYAAWGAAAAALATYPTARRAPTDAAWGAAADGARGVALDAALALVVRDRIPTEHFDTLVGPLRAAGLTITQEDQ